MLTAQVSGKMSSRKTIESATQLRRVKECTEVKKKNERRDVPTSGLSSKYGSENRREGKVKKHAIHRQPWTIHLYAPRDNNINYPLQTLLFLSRHS